jgi:hypothetical protein
VSEAENSEREGARREQAELHKRLEVVGPLSGERLVLHMRIARVKRRLDALDPERTET